MKRYKAAIITACILFVLALAGTATLVARAITNDKNEKQLKAEKEKAPIVELFHDQGSIYMEPVEPKKGEDVTIRLRTERYNVTKAQIQYTTDNGVTWKTADMKYEGEGKNDDYDVWKGSFKAEGDLMYYRFAVSNTDSFNAVYYDSRKIDANEGEYTNGWQIVPDGTTPDWAKGALWYSAMPDAFYNGNTTNDKHTSGSNYYTTWNKLRSGLGERYGGDLQGIETKLDYIADLGVDALYFNPINKSYQVAGYEPVRYDEIDSALGNEEDLVNLVSAAHEKDLKVMGDVVLTFTNNASYYFNQNEYWPVVGSYQSKDSEWYNLAKFYNWPDNYMVTWNQVANDLNSDTAKELLYANDSSYLMHYAKIFDGYRYDCGGWLWGTSETENVYSGEIVAEMREALKDVNKDFLLIAESDAKNLNTNTWDGHWNINYMDALQDYAKGLINEDLMLEAVQKYIDAYPRYVALCLINMMSSHDGARVVQEDNTMYNAALLLQMNYVGSPSIYYGEEMGNIKETEGGIGSTQSFYSMDWNEKNWNQERLAFYKATAELRKEYTCLKTGVVKVLSSDINENRITFGRWDEDGAAITVTSQNAEAMKFDIEAGLCDIADGTILTDWYTGAEYEVKDGKITAEVMPGGTVFVTGKKSSSYRDGFTVQNIGNTSKKNSVLAKDEITFVTDGKGNITGKKDTLTYASKLASDDFSVFANLKGKKSATLMIRESENANAPYYAAVVSGSQLKIIARKTADAKPVELLKTSCDANTYVKLERDGDNHFSASVAKVSGGQLSAFEELKGADVNIAMNASVYYGFAGLGGEMKISNLTFEAGTSNKTFDDFDGKTPVSLFDGITDSNVSIKDGELKLSAKKKQDFTSLLTSAMDSDWTFKANYSYQPKDEEYAGVVSWQDENNFVLAGQKLIDGKTCLFIGKYTNGKLDVYDYVNDSANTGNVLIQLQRIGAYYSAVYSADDGKTWEYIGKVFANYSYSRVGLMINGKSALTVDYVSYGDSINNGKSVNTPYTPVDLDITYNTTGLRNEAKYQYVSGEWSLVDAGWKQKDDSVYGIAAAINQQYEDLYAEATILPSGSGWAGIGFGLSDYKDKSNKGFHVRYTEDKMLSLTKNGKTIDEVKVEPEEDGSLRVVVYASEEVIKVYAGQYPMIAISAPNTGYSKGYVAFCTEDAAGEFRNLHIGHMAANWICTSGSATGSGTSIVTTNQVESGRQIYSVNNLVGCAFTDVIFSVKLASATENEKADSMAGILLAAGEGRSDKADGVLIGLNGKGELVLSVQGSIKASYKLPEGQTSAQIMGVKQAGEYKVFLEGKTEPILSYSEEMNRGGVFAVYSYNTVGTFMNLEIENLQPGEDYSKTNTAVKWAETKSRTFSDNLNSNASEDNYLFYQTTYGDYSVKDGALVCENSTGWSAGATIKGQDYKDFTMEFKLKLNKTTNGWMSVGIRKANPLGTHNDTGVSVMLTENGYMFIFDGLENKEYAATTCKSYRKGDWNDVKIVAQGQDITVYMNGEKMMTYKDTKCGLGFISFMSGMTNYEVDNIKITPLD